jgi:hypothetical protein
MFRLVILSLITFSAVASISHNEMLVNKYYIFKKLKIVYGERSTKYIKKYILAETKSFGGVCDPYNHEKGNKEEYGMEYECFKGLTTLRGGDFSSPSVTRELYMEKACQAITNDEVIQKKFVKTSTSYNAFNKHYKEYLPSKDLNKAVYKHIMSLKSSPKDKWILFSKVMCRSLEWQKI